MIKTAMEKMIEAVENGYHKTSSWSEWKSTLLEDEKNQISGAYAAGFQEGINDEKGWLKYKNGWHYYNQNYKTAVKET